MSKSRKIAIVTGASSGLGRQFVQELDKGTELEEIWVIARRKDRLEEVARETTCEVRVFSADLGQNETFDTFTKIFQKEAPDIRLLVNCAGFGKIGSYRDLTSKECADMIDLNCRGAVLMTQICIPYMQSGARILEIASTSAFQPFPFLNVYAASKAFLLRYSRALRWELREQGIAVTAVCPYWIKDTEFIPGAKKTKNGNAIRHFPLASRSKAVVRRALRDSRAGFAVSTPGPVCFLHRITSKLIPDCIMIAIWEGIRRL